MIDLNLYRKPGPLATEEYIARKLQEHATKKGAQIIKMWTSLGEDYTDMRGGWNHPLAPHYHAWIMLQDGTKQKLFFDKTRKKHWYAPRGWKKEYVFRTD